MASLLSVTYVLKKVIVTPANISLTLGLKDIRYEGVRHGKYHWWVLVSNVMNVRARIS
jgi:hypothetical protein